MGSKISYSEAYLNNLTCLINLNGLNGKMLQDLINTFQLHKIRMLQSNIMLLMAPCDMIRNVRCVSSCFKYRQNIRLYRISKHQKVFRLTVEML